MRYGESFFWGVLAAAGALVLQMFFSLLGELFFSIETQRQFIDGLLTASPVFFVVAVVIEEILKYAFILQRAHRLQCFGRAIMIHALFIGSGFATLELVFLLFRENTLSAIFSTDALGIFLLHILTAGIIGFVCMHMQSPITKFVRAIFIVSLIHVFYNILTLSLLTAPLRLPVFILGIFTIVVLLLSVIFSPIERPPRGDLA